MIKRGISVLVITILFLGINAIAKAISPEEAAQAGANDWLIFVDSQKYVESWGAASNIFKNVITAEQWKQSLSSAREPFGKLISRKMSKQKHYSTLPGVSDGSYFVIQYNSKFENKENAAETVTVAKEKDGTWKVAGYFIK